MKIFKIEVENFRLLKDFQMDLEDELSLVIGKNNTGKTSILSVLDKFLNPSEKNRFNFDDFNIDFKKNIEDLIGGNNPIGENDYKEKGIRLKLFIQYTETCNLENVSRVMMDLDPENNYIALGFEYLLSFEKYLEIRKDYQEFKVNEENKQSANEDYKPKSLYDFLRKNHDKYFKSYRKSIEINKDTKIVNDENFIDLDKELISIKDLVNFKYISARREVANKDVDKTLSTQTSKIYEKTETSSDQNKAVEDFKDRLSETDDQLSDIYVDLFKTIIKKVGDFGGIKPNESEIEIISNLQHRELLKGNATVVYKHDDDNKLPEHYNGLGYMNLICMIFEIEILIQEFKCEKEKKPADINLLFIEEPEAHTHPQMQYVFIKNIKKLLKEGIQREDGEKRKLQYIISSHSSHIVADSDFDDIKYLKKENSNSVIAKNLKDLKKEYDAGTTQYQFLTQYLTISRAEIFFAKKVVLIEGDTERMLIPTMMKKIDIEEAVKHEEAGTKDDYLPLLSQNISIVEVGAYSQIFDQFIDFLGIRTLVITDLDATKEVVNDKGKQVRCSCPVAEGESYSNEAISHFFNSPALVSLKGYSFQNKLFNKDNGTWLNQPDGKLCVVYQTDENGYNARSFEDAFIHLNRNFVKDNKESFKGLKSKEDFDEPANGAYHLAKNCVKKKTHFALDILFHSDEKLSNWQIPAYIKEGLLWLKQD
jgi:predicted ATP-dependent endonuclease of OLD family